MPYRKAARVLPDPVGAWISVWPPRAIAGQPSACAGVGSANARSNQTRVSALNTASGSTRPAYRASSPQRLGDLQQLGAAEIAGYGDDEFRRQRPNMRRRSGIDVELRGDTVERATMQRDRARVRRQPGGRAEWVAPPSVSAPPRRYEELVKAVPVGERHDVARRGIVDRLRAPRLARDRDLGQAVAGRHAIRSERLVADDVRHPLEPDPAEALVRTEYLVPTRKTKRERLRRQRPADDEVLDPQLALDLPAEGVDGAENDSRLLIDRHVEPVIVAVPAVGARRQHRPPRPPPLEDGLADPRVARRQKSADHGAEPPLEELVARASVRRPRRDSRDDRREAGPASERRRHIERT